MMTSSDFDVEFFERKLYTLKDSQESIQGLSAWCLERRQHHKKIVATWLQVLKKGKYQMLNLSFYSYSRYYNKDHNNAFISNKKCVENVSLCLC